MAPTTIARELTIGQLAERSGVAASALRFYEDQGLIHSRRTSGNQRRYPRDMLRRVAFVRVSQNLGISLAEIRDALALLPDHRTPTPADWAAVSACWRQDLDERIRQLTDLRDHLSNCIGCGCLSLSECALANPGDVLAQEGPGAYRFAHEGGCDGTVTGCGGPDGDSGPAGTGGSAGSGDGTGTAGGPRSR
ncbi:MULTISPECIES: redox-sensitive transcriptional activator SoxR [unclassified Streptomyces]|uniref:redox-sensitive transcriptional activator SoxR n=1 Tax=unclassified Streptomyces TaxID=2593676 RepID=UPI000CD4F5E6|nr:MULTISPECIES: redox-sensitive transcriptional activator SoxR [unclassified Streptomyces]